MSDDKFHSSSEWKRIRASYLATMTEYNCTGCGKPDLHGIDLHVDHINPGHQGNGEYEWDNSFDNLRILCSVCNGRKKDIKSVGLKRVDWKNNAWF